jgi:hypothetical protein
LGNDSETTPRPPGSGSAHTDNTAPPTSQPGGIRLPSDPWRTIRTSTSFVCPPMSATHTERGSITQAAPG